MKLNKSVWFCLLFSTYVLATCCSCRSVKNLTKKIDTILTQHDSTAKTESVNVKTDTSKFNSEIVIEYSDTAAEKKLTDGAEVDWQPFVVDVHSEQIPSIHTNQKVKRIIIRTNADTHTKDSSVINSEGTVKNVNKSTSSEKVLAKKTVVRFPWWILIFVGVILFLLYEKYKVKIKAVWSSISAIR